MMPLYAYCIKNIDPITKKEEEELIIGNLYKVDYISMGQSHTNIYLEGIKKGFNSIYFKFFEEVDIFSNKKYNPYL